VCVHCACVQPGIHPSIHLAPRKLHRAALLMLLSGYMLFLVWAPRAKVRHLFFLFGRCLSTYIFSHIDSYTPNVGRESFGPPSFPSLAYRCTHTNEVVSTAFKEASQGPRLLRIDFGPSSAVEKSPVAVGFERSVTWEISIRWDPHPIMK
jgi:hypothetical protein